MPKQAGTYRWVHSTVDIGHMLTLNCLPKLNKYVHHMAMDISPDQQYCGKQSVNGPNIPITLVHSYNIHKYTNERKEREKREIFVKISSF